MSNFKGFKPESDIFIIPERVDFRLSINVLTAYVQEILKISPMENACFVFCKRNSNKLKIVQWDFNGFWLHYKRLESGKFHWPSPDSAYLPITKDQYDWLMNQLERWVQAGVCNQGHLDQKALKLPNLVGFKGFFVSPDMV